MASGLFDHVNHDPAKAERLFGWLRQIVQRRLLDDLSRPGDFALIEGGDALHGVLPLDDELPLRLPLVPWKRYGVSLEVVEPVALDVGQVLDNAQQGRVGGNQASGRLFLGKTRKLQARGYAFSVEVCQ